MLATSSWISNTPDALHKPHRLTPTEKTAHVTHISVEISSPVNHYALPFVARCRSPHQEVPGQYLIPQCEIVREKELRHCRPSVHTANISMLWPNTRNMPQHPGKRIKRSISMTNPCHHPFTVNRRNLLVAFGMRCGGNWRNMMTSIQFLHFWPDESTGSVYYSSFGKHSGQTHVFCVRQFVAFQHNGLRHGQSVFLSAVRWSVPVCGRHVHVRLSVYWDVLRINGPVRAGVGKITTNNLAVSIGVYITSDNGGINILLSHERAILSRHNLSSGTASRIVFSSGCKVKRFI